MLLVWSTRRKCSLHLIWTFSDNFARLNKKTHFENKSTVDHTVRTFEIAMRSNICMDVYYALQIYAHLIRPCNRQWLLFQFEVPLKTWRIAPLNKQLEFYKKHGLKCHCKRERKGNASNTLTISCIRENLNIQSRKSSSFSSTSCR